ncbi:hypothetical protein LTR10_012579 [Elasticomyces elasticus]|uniref:Ppx/GppA phosphatase domain-containing protein n=1 Tax=Exophiala sideris TaxID=1016849 RepID=A0ABR0JS08_9EURO|nr:hypothetical protein LTR10_012579 [Elasticomyces elasticus]KAK5040221.1 hypothetical protein LTS07_000718 [Exophiala sideris]KAK5043354.1 hypothetical protein LTR13_001125 [Exophiala sideris]KAK5068599.1 hypothetical protein LTR69_000719 [Exophiala sideris]KAK5186197.1 hypothetical protein LTR44_001252 [Eurotiomycetes sp. CCFEE 6388]
MASSVEDTEMTDAPIRQMQRLQIHELNDVLDRVGLANGDRLHIGIDFGTKSSSICYDRSSSPLRLLDCEAAANIIDDHNRSDRIATVAAFTEEHDTTTNTSWQLDFGARASRNTTSIGQKHIVKIEMMKLHLLCGQGGANHDPTTMHMLNDINEHHENVIRAICNDSSGVRCRVQDPLSQEYKVCNIRSVRCVIKEFLRYLLQSAKAHFASRHELQPAAVTTIFQEKAEVAISVPTNTLWTDSTMDRFQELLREAEFPEVTILVSEAKSAAFYHVFELSKTAGTDAAREIAEQITIIADIGGGTTDITCLGSYYATEDCDTISFGEIASGVGSLNGSEKLNTLFKQYLQQQLPGGISELVPGFHGSELQLSEVFATAFEVAKRNFDNTEASYDVAPRFATRLRLQKMGLEGSVVHGDRLTLDACIMQEIFDEWLAGIVSMLQEFMAEVTRGWTNTTPIVVGLTGWGSLPPYVLQFFNAHFSSQGVRVQMMETKTRPAVALGNYLQLVNQDLAHTQIAHNQHVARIGDDEAKMMADLRYSKHGPPTDVEVPQRGPDLDQDLKRALLAQIAKES